MRKFVKFLLVLLLGFVFIPMVHAEELPTEGVTYFMTYPNGEVVATESYEEAVSLPEKLLFSIETNENGVAPLCDCNQGTLRLVQHVPNGYTTNQREITVVLDGSMNNASFVDYRGGNPVTSRSLVVLLVLAAVVAVTVIVSRKNKKALMLIPVFVLLGYTFTVYALPVKEDCFSVRVTDGSGEPLANVTIDVYGTPVVDAAPALKFDANGGHFFDGSEVFYVRLPQDPCTVDELWDSFTGDEYSYYLDNLELAYRDGYEYDEVEYPSTITNGSVARVLWDENVDTHYIRISGNGGTYDFYGEPLEDVYVRADSYPFGFFNNFKNGDSYLVGYDNNAACENYTAAGTSSALKRIEDVNMNVVETVYLCWNAKPDGIYVNDVLFKGNANGCFFESGLEDGDDEYFLYNTYRSEGNYELDIIRDEPIAFALYEYNVLEAAFSSIQGAGYDYDSDTIYSIEVVSNGQTIASLGENDLVINRGAYDVKDNSISELLIDYFSPLSSCSIYAPKTQD